MNPKLVPLSLQHYPGDLICRARQEWRRWARVRDAAGTAMVLIVAVTAIYLLFAALNSVQPPVGP